MGKNEVLKVIFNDFPGGAHGFELIVRFCYSGTKMVITPSNIVLLYCAAHFMEMHCDGPSGTSNVISQIENFLEEGIHLWTWFELLEALRQCQEYSISSKSYFTILDRIVDHLIERLVILPSTSSPYTCSSNRSSSQFSCETSSNNSWRNNCSGPSWWFEHLLFLKVDLIDKIVRSMISHDFDHALVSKFLFHYHKLSCIGAVKSKSKMESAETTEVVINLLSLLDKRSFSFKDLFSLYHVGFKLRIISSCCKNKILSLIGPFLDQVAIDYLLLPPPKERKHAFDVDFVLRLAQVFVNEGDFGISLARLKRVAKTMDSFLIEVSPDCHLQPSEFAELITVLPDAARESHDLLYLAMDIYLKSIILAATLPPSLERGPKFKPGVDMVHAGLTEKEKISICCALNHEKLSAQLLRNLTRNLVFPAQAKPRSHAHTQSRIKNLLQENDHLKYFLDSLFRRSFKNTDAKEDSETRTADDGDELKPEGDLHVMQSVMKSGCHIMNNSRYLPKLCSR
ncbi:BTB/POZ domain-containing protein At3g22104-like isoform X3 [Prosopis cineraria]|nr:BTB/POZ domain-containing protein At3g22104-like isoform X3 [Prosopis cineraria]